MAKEKLHFVLTVLIALGLTFAFYGNILMSPNSYLLSGEGDGLKNYFTYTYFVQHNQSLSNFEGMNYPYGEHILYTDCHPVFAVSLKKLTGYFPTLNNYSIGILNFLLLLGYFLTYPVAYLLLRKIGTTALFSLLFSTVIGLMSPQLFRLTGHYALSYSVAVPLSWLLMILWKQNPNNYFIGLGVLLNFCFWMVIHAYLGIICIGFAGLMVLVDFLYETKNRKAIFNNATKLIACFLPVLLFTLYLNHTDIHIGRTDNPSGFFLYNAELDDLFIPHHGFFRDFLESIIPGVIKQEWEAWSYVGLPTGLLLVVLFFASVMGFVKKAPNHTVSTMFKNGSINIALIASFVILVFALILPFKVFPSLADSFPFVKQFRATGRFAWPFFFVILVFSAQVFEKFYFRTKENRHLWRANILMVVVILVYAIEGIAHNRVVASSLGKSQNIFHKKFIPEKYKQIMSVVENEKYQALLPIPYFHIGSETFSRIPQQEPLEAAMVLSHHTGLPIIGGYLTRVSVEEGKKSVQLMSPDFYEKKMKDDFQNNKPLLLIVANNAITEYEQQLLKKATLIDAVENVKAYELQLDELFKSSVQNLGVEFRKKKDNLYKNKKGFLQKREDGFLYYNSYENNTNADNFRGQGAYSGTKKGKNTLAEFPPHTFEEGKEYKLSIWMRNAQKDALNLWLRLIVEEYDDSTEQYFSTTFFPEHAETINGDWSLVEGMFKVKSASNGIAIVSIGKENSKAELFADDLLIIEKGDSIYKITETELFLNNHKILLKNK